MIISVCLVIFVSKYDRFCAEDLFNSHGFVFELIPSPIWIRTNCDYAMRFDASLQEQIKALLLRHRIGIEHWITNSAAPLTLADRLKQQIDVRGKSQ